MRRQITITILATAAVLAIAVIFFVVRQTFAPTDSGAATLVVYVSPTGNDTNTGTQAAPYKTFTKAVSALIPGAELRIMAGTYNQQLRITKSGTATAPILVAPMTPGTVVIDLQNSKDKGIEVPAANSYINVEGIEVKNSNGYCVAFSGQHLEIRNLKIHDCVAMGLYIDGKSMLVEGNTVYLASTENRARTASSGWGSGIKLKVGAENITLQNNVTYNNYGEGIAATRAKNTIIRDNLSYDNFAVQIYVDNSINTLVERNFTYCSANSGFEYSDGSRPNGIAIGEEQYDGWGAQLQDAFIYNNIVNGCKRGIARWAADVSGGGLRNGIIAHNVVWNATETGLTVDYDATKQSIQIYNNVFSVASGATVCSIDNVAGTTLNYNFWVGALPASNCRGANDKSGDVKMASTPNLTDANSYRLASNSPAINAALAMTQVPTDYSKAARNGVPDIGAFEYGGAVASTSISSSSSAIASSSSIVSTSRTTSFVISITSSSSPACRADYDANGQVGISDFAVFAANYKKTGINCNLDLAGGDCYLGIADFQQFGQVYKQPTGGECYVLL